MTPCEEFGAIFFVGFMRSKLYNAEQIIDGYKMCIDLKRHCGLFVMMCRYMFWAWSNYIFVFQCVL